MTDLNLSQSDCVGQQRPGDQLFLINQNGETEQARRPITGPAGSGDPENWAYQIAVLTVGLDCDGRILGVVPHFPYGPIDDGLFGETMTPENLCQEAAWFIIENSDTPDILDDGLDGDVIGHYLDVELAYGEMGLKDDSSVMFNLMLRLFLQGDLTWKQSRIFLSALAKSYTWLGFLDEEPVRRDLVAEFIEQNRPIVENRGK